MEYHHEVGDTDQLGTSPVDAPRKNSPGESSRGIVVFSFRFPAQKRPLTGRKGSTVFSRHPDLTCDILGMDYNGNLLGDKVYLGRQNERMSTDIVYIHASRPTSPR